MLLNTQRQVLIRLCRIASSPSSARLRIKRTKGHRRQCGCYDDVRAPALARGGQRWTVLVLLAALGLAFWMSGGQDGSSNGRGHIELTVWDDVPAVAPGGVQLRVLTLNCWGLWIVAKKRQQRIRYVAHCLKRTSCG